MKPKYTRGEILETILARSIRDEIDISIVDFLKNGKPHNLSPMIFEDSEVESRHREYMKIVLERDIDNCEIIEE